MSVVVTVKAGWRRLCGRRRRRRRRLSLYPIKIKGWRCLSLAQCGLLSLMQIILECMEQTPPPPPLPPSLLFFSFFPILALYSSYFLPAFPSFPPLFPYSICCIFLEVIVSNYNILPKFIHRNSSTK